MGRVLALDVGSKRIGVAVSDETATLAFPRPPIWRQEGYRRDMAAIRDLVQSEEVAEIVIGMPAMLSGHRGVQAAKMEDFAAKLRRYVSVPVSFQDERLTTGEAEKALIAGNVRPGDRKRSVDSMAASLILQAYLDRRRAGRE